MCKEEIGQDLPYKLLTEDLFIRKFMHGTFVDLVESEVIIIGQHSLVRIACIINRKIMPRFQCKIETSFVQCYGYAD